MPPILLAALLAATPAPAAASLPAATSARIDAAVRQVLAADGTPSASVAVVLQRRIVYARAFGFASLAPRRAATVATRYQLASASKSITAQTLLLLAVDGRLSLDEPIARWLPQVTAADRLTVRQLLEHVSGLPDHYPQSYPAAPRGEPTTPDRILAEWGRHPLLFAPGAQFRYSNLNYLAAGRIAERASGEPLFALQRRLIFAPLGMTGAIDLDTVTPRTADVATGYVRIGMAPLEPAPAEGPGWSFGAGQVVATASDLARWDIGLLTAALLPPAAIREETTPPTLTGGARSPYALGLFVSARSGRTVWSHTGQGLGFLAGNSIFPDQGAAIVVLTNGGAQPSFARIADRIAFLLLPPTPADARARALWAGLAAGRVARETLTPAFAAFLDAPRLRRWRAGLGRLGGLTSLVLRSEDVADGVTTRRYDATAGGRAFSVLWAEDAAGRTDDFAVQSAT